MKRSERRHRPIRSPGGLRYLRSSSAVRLTLGTAVLACAAGCGDGVAHTAVEDTVIPVQPVAVGLLGAFTDASSPPYAARVDLTETPSRIVWARPLALAVGPGYPSTYTATIDRLMLSDCGGASAGSYEGIVTLREVSGSTHAVAGAVANDAQIVLSIADEGDLTLVATGEVDVIVPGGCASAGIHPFELQLAVTAFRPRGTAFAVPPSCAQAGVKRVAVGGRMSDQDFHVTGRAPAMFRPLPLNPSGAATQVANADPLAQVAVRIEGPLVRGSAASTPPAYLDALVFPDVPGTVRFTPGVGEALDVEVVDARRVDRIDVAVQVAGFAGAPLSLMDQAAYDASGWGRKRNRVEPRVMGTYVGSDPLCSAPAHAWFAFTSATPTVCPTMPVSLPTEGSYLFDGLSIGHGSRFDADGTCSLSVQAPDFDGGAGLAQTVTFDIANVTALDAQLAP